MYITIYPFTLWFSPIYFIATDEKKAMKTLAYGLLLIYSIALPVYLFMSITNVYTFYNLESALNNVILTVENFFYTTTTQNNCLLSLHVAMPILIARFVHLTGNKKFLFYIFLHSICYYFSYLFSHTLDYRCNMWHFASHSNNILIESFHQG